MSSGVASNTIFAGRHCPSAERPQRLLKAADDMLYRAKTAGGNVVAYYDDGQM
jgi:PleD family two-component response regulator